MRINVTKAPGGSFMADVPAGTTIGEAIRQSGAGDFGNFEIRINGTSFRADQAIPDGTDSILLVQRVKGNKLVRAVRKVIRFFSKR